MSTNENKNIVLRKWYEELWDKWDIKVADELQRLTALKTSRNLLSHQTNANSACSFC